MNLFKKGAIVIILLMVTSSFSQAIIKNIKSTPASEIADKSTKLMTKKLTLTEEQQGKVFTIYEENWALKKEIISNASFFTFRGKMKDQNELQNKSFYEVLTIEQMALYNERVFDEIKAYMKEWLQNK